MDRLFAAAQLSAFLFESRRILLDLKETMAAKSRDAGDRFVTTGAVNTELQEGLMPTRMVPLIACCRVCGGWSGSRWWSLGKQVTLDNR